MADRPILRSTLLRAARLRCAACGIGRVYRRGLVRSELCSHCGWRFERGEGHWVGGSELHMFAIFGLSATLLLPPLFLVGFTTAAMAAVVAGSAALSVAGLRWSRSFFLAVDYFLDPRPDADDREPPGPLPAPSPDLPGLATRRRRGTARVR